MTVSRLNENLQNLSGMEGIHSTAAQRINF